MQLVIVEYHPMTQDYYGIVITNSVAHLSRTFHATLLDLLLTSFMPTVSLFSRRTGCRIRSGVIRGQCEHGPH